MKAFERYSLASAVVAGFAAMAAQSGPELGFGSSLWPLATASLLTVHTLIVWSIALIRRDLRKAKAPRYVLIHAALLSALVAVSFSLWPLRARVAVSDYFLRSYAESVASGSRTPVDPPPLLGLLRFEAARNIDGAVVFDSGPCGFVGLCGLLYIPAGGVPSELRNSSHHLYGPWWRYETAFD